MAASGHETISIFKRYNLVDESEVKTLIEDSGMDTYMDTRALGSQILKGRAMMLNPFKLLVLRARFEPARWSPTEPSFVLVRFVCV